MYTIIHFSPTGNAAYVAQLLQTALNCDKLSQPLEHLNPEKMPKDQHLVIVTAIHAFNVPRTVKRFINDLPVGLYENISLISVGCNDVWVNDSVTKDIRKKLESKNYPIIVDAVIAMPLTFITAFPEAIIQQQLSDALNIVNQLATLIIEEIPSDRSISFGSKVLHFIGHAESGAARLFGLELHASSACTQCGLCVRECPEKNIRMDEDGRLHFGFSCLMCMRCIYQCPEKAISPRISKFIPIKRGYALNHHLKRL